MKFHRIIKSNQIENIKSNQLKLEINMRDHKCIVLQEATD